MNPYKVSESYCNISGDLKSLYFGKLYVDFFEPELMVI